MCRVYSNMLMVGVKDRARQLRELPLRVLALDTAGQAIKCLRHQRVDSVISHWDLVDMPDGELLKRICSARPQMPTVVFIKAGDRRQEILARSLGVTAILSDDIDDDFFRSTVCQILNIEQIASVSACAEGFGTLTTE